jgi:hypothetical protein
MKLTIDQTLKEQELWSQHFPEDGVPYTVWKAWKLRAEIAQDELHALREENAKLREHIALHTQLDHKESQ